VPGEVLGVDEAMVAVKVTLMLVLGVEEWQLKITISRARRLQQAVVGDWNVEYEVVVPPEEVESVQSSTETISQNATNFGENLKQQLVSVGVSESILEKSFTMGTFTANEIVMTTITDVPSELAEGSSPTAAFVGGASGGLLVLVALCLHFRYRRPREVIAEVEIDVVGNDLEDPKGLQSKMGPRDSGIEMEMPRDLQPENEPNEETWSIRNKVETPRQTPPETLLEPQPETPREPQPETPRELQLETDIADELEGTQMGNLHEHQREANVADEFICDGFETFSV